MWRLPFRCDYMGFMTRYEKYTAVFCSDYAILTNRMYVCFPPPPHNTPGLLGFSVCVCVCVYIKRMREPMYSFMYQTPMTFKQQRYTD